MSASPAPQHDTRPPASRQASDLRELVNLNVSVGELMDRLADGVLLVGSDGVVRYANTAAAGLFGRSQEELIGTILGLPMSTGERTELELNRPDGQPVWVELCTATVMLNDGAALLGNLRDITDRRELEQQLRRSQKMEAVGRLAGGIAHDFNNLLTVITGYAEVLIKEGRCSRPGEPVPDALQQIRLAAEGAFGMTRQLLSLAREHQSSPVVFSLNDLLERIRGLLQSHLGESISVRLQLCEGGDTIHADPGLMEQVVINLVLNARDAMPEGGNLTLQTTSTDTRVHLAVTDTGCGMEPEAAARAFEPFFTTKGPEEGTGLGLSTAFGIVAEAGGTIDLETEPGAGTTFRLSFRRQNSDLRDRPPRATPPGDAVTGVVRDTGRGRILVVEDGRSLRDLVRFVLEDAGHRVHAAARPSRALALIADDEPLDLVITDVIMPEMKGHELARRIREMRPGLRVLYMSGYTAGEVGDDGTAGSIEFIQKPFTPEELLKRVDALLTTA